MPSLNIRLTDEQLAQLRKWAVESDRSIQKEIVHRLFRYRQTLRREVLQRKLRERE